MSDDEPKAYSFIGGPRSGEVFVLRRAVNRIHFNVLHDGLTVEHAYHRIAVHSKQTMQDTYSIYVWDELLEEKLDPDEMRAIYLRDMRDKDFTKWKELRK